MKIIFRDLKKGVLKIAPQSQDDLWLLSQMIDKGAVAGARTTRKVKISESKVDKKSYYIEISVENVEYVNDALRVSGRCVSELEDVPKGSHHTLAVGMHDELKVVQKWLRYQVQRIEESAKAVSKVLMLCLDREEAYFAVLEQDSYKVLLNIEGDVEKKVSGTRPRGGFYAEIVSKLTEYDERLSPGRIIVASPAFFKDDFYKLITSKELKAKIILATCSSVSESAFNEIIKREEVKSALDSERARQELLIVDELFTEIAKDGKYAYGITDVTERVKAGAVEKLMLTGGLINKLRQDGTFGEVERMMQAVESSNGRVVIISSANDAGKRLDGIGGIGAVLRYKRY